MKVYLSQWNFLFQCIFWVNHIQNYRLKIQNMKEISFLCFRHSLRYSQTDVICERLDQYYLCTGSRTTESVQSYLPWASWPLGHHSWLAEEHFVCCQQEPGNYERNHSCITFLPHHVSWDRYHDLLCTTLKSKSLGNHPCASTICGNKSKVSEPIAGV